MNRAGLIAAVEAAYDLGSDDAQWLDLLCQAVARDFQPSLGVMAYFHEAAPSLTQVQSTQHVTRHAPGGASALIRELADGASPEVVRDLYVSGPVSGTMADALPPPMTGRARSIFHHHVGARDTFCVMARVPTGRSVCINLLSRDPLPDSSPQLLERYDRLAAHIAAGLRLRQGVASQEAVLEPDGRCLDASQEAVPLRERLREAVRERERALRSRSDDEAALELWQGLVSGRWSLVDSYEASGRRYVVARENTPRHPDPRSLTPRERQVAALLASASSNKLIAYTLGLSVSTVGDLVASIQRKLGSEGRADLVTLLRALRVSPDEHEA
ncbi:MAG: helix-turn-helix transcriptional regulator [Polyangiaceae bacterium]